MTGKRDDGIASNVALNQRIYFDNAATSWPKPECVYETVDRYQRQWGCAAGRGGYARAIEINQQVYRTRQRIARFLGISDAERIIFAHNGTDALNLALHGVLRPGDHVVTTNVEHNSVLRPLAWAAKHHGVDVSYVGCDAAGKVSIDDIKKSLRSSTRLVAITHASNVTGAIQPIEDAAAEAHRVGAFILVDAAQSVGHVPMSTETWAIDLLACSGHKGLLGPLGTGVLYVAPSMDEHVLPIRQGGTGTDSQSELPPASMPDRFEAGNLNLPGILGLGAAVEYLLEGDHWEQGHRHELQLAEYLLDRLADQRHVQVFGPPLGVPRTPVVSVQVTGYDPSEVASILDTTAGIEVRSGLHCAPRLHAAIGTDRNGGTVRISLGRFNQRDEVETLVALLNELA